MVVSIATKLIFCFFLKNLIILVGLQKFSIRTDKFYVVEVYFRDTHSATPCNSLKETYVTCNFSKQTFVEDT